MEEILQKKHAEIILILDFTNIFNFDTLTS